MTPARTLLDYAVSAFALRVATGERPTFDGCLAEALFIYGDIDHAALERYRTNATDLDAVDVADCGSGGVSESEGVGG